MSQVTPVDEEFFFEGSVIISQTDLNGVITYANRKFCEVSGYSADELVGQPHNIIRHPQMPKVAFEKMWNSISSGHTWNGLVKNMRKDGRYYWVDTEILPIHDENNEITGYIASRKAASRKDIEESEAVYRKMYQDQQ
jgi:aerotaxis receptor